MKPYLKMRRNYNKNPVSVIDLKSGEKFPRVVMAALTSEAIIKTAFNASSKFRGCC